MAEIQVGVRREVLPYLDKGTKDLEVRGASPFFKKIRVGDVIVFAPRLRRRVTRIASYPSFEVVVDSEDYRRIMPTAENSGQVLAMLRLFMKDHGDRNGALVFELVWA